MQLVSVDEPRVVLSLQVGAVNVIKLQSREAIGDSVFVQVTANGDIVDSAHVKATSTAAHKWTSMTSDAGGQLQLRIGASPGSESFASAGKVRAMRRASHFHLDLYICPRSSFICYVCCIQGCKSATLLRFVDQTGRNGLIERGAWIGEVMCAL